jgi:hypothetical protein
MVAPAALGLIGHEAARLLRQVDQLLQRIYGGKGPSPPVTLGGAVRGRFSFSGEATVRPPAGAPLEILVNHLMQELDMLRNRVREQERKQHSDHEALTARLDRHDSEDAAAHQALMHRIEDDKRQDTQLNAKGLPLIALGILLTGVPDGLAVVGWLGWTIVVLSAFLALWLGVWPCAVWIVHKIRRAAPGRPASPGLP